jgi:hypothetical protein
MAGAMVLAGLLLALQMPQGGMPQGGMPQINGPLGDGAVKAKGFVDYTAEKQTVPVGKRAELELHFRVVKGFHVNSHTPKSELLIPTKLDAKLATGVLLGSAQYPAGKPYSLPANPKEKLDVYTDDFVVTLPVMAAAGEHTISATLRYQACDQAACYPPKSLPVEVLFTAK